MTQQTDINAPWSLHFDSDGTEDIAVICDAAGEELAHSREFWLPAEGDAVPPTLAAMQLMVAAPKLLAALKALAKQAHEHCRSEDLAEALAQADKVIAEASGMD